MKKYLPLLTLSSTILLSGSLANASQPTNSLGQLYANAEKSGLSQQVLSDALKSDAWAKAHGTVENPNILTVVDYSKPSTEKRLWVLDLKTDTVLMNTLVAQGKNTGLNYATHFSNDPSSHETSLGVYTTGMSPYFGKHGRSLKVYGLEKGINNNAYSRAIEIHGASYVSASVAESMGRLGRTFGCFGVSQDAINKIVNYTQGGSVLFAYAQPENNDPILKGTA